MRIYLDQLGCRLNYSENETLAGQLLAAGHHVVARAEEAQVIVLNTCAVTVDAGKRSRQSVRQLHQRNPAARIAVTGCYATLEPGKTAALPGVALVADNREKELLHSLLEPWSAELDDPAQIALMQPNGVPFAQDAEAAPSRTRAFIKVQDGCNNKCTFCVVTLARGESRSRTVAEIVAEVQTLAADGVQEAVLTGVHLGSFGRDLAGSARSDLKALTAALLADTDMPRLRLSSLEPWELVEGFFDLWQDWPERLCPHLHLPLQAGTDRQLRHMARRCTVESYRQLVLDARSAIPDLTLTTDLIVGFPGESEADFRAGMGFVKEMAFVDAHIFPYSPRPGTAAAGFADPLPNLEKKARSQRMHEVVAATGRAQRLRFVGGVRPVLWEGRGLPVEDQPGMALWRGYTDNYLRVMAHAPAGVDLHNVLTPTRLDELHGDTFLGSLSASDPRIFTNLHESQSLSF